MARIEGQPDDVYMLYSGKVAADASLILLGRGSNCINTGGEKVFPEEVEEAVKAHPAVYDCLVASETDVLEVAAEHIARYKLPKQVIVVDSVQRAPNGKADYPWARDVVAKA